MPKYKSLQEVQTAIKNKETNCVQLVQYYLNQIEQSQSLNAYVEVYAEEALAKAALLDQKYAEEEETVGKLFGMVVAIKDVLCYADHKVSAGSKILADFTSLFSATAVDRLVKEDAIIIGRVNCDEFAMGSTNETSFHGPVKNAADPKKVPGGSSGGSAVAVQADTCLASLGQTLVVQCANQQHFVGLLALNPVMAEFHGMDF